MLDHLLSEEGRAIRDEARAFVTSLPRQMIIDMDNYRICIPKEFLREAGRRNLLGCRHPKRWGGRDLDWVTTCTVMEEIGTLGYILACAFGVGAELVCDAIIRHGSEAQKEKYVRPLLRGEIVAAECLTEPRGGSDFFCPTTTAEDRGDHFVINGEKCFIVGADGADGADFFLVYARTDPDAEPHKALSCLIVDRGPGMKVRHRNGPMGYRGGGTSRLMFSNVRVPKENVVGRINGAYPVFETMMIPERLGTAAMTVGAARPALEIAAGYTTRRRAFGTAAQNFQSVSSQVAEAVMLLNASRAMIDTAARAVDADVDVREVRRLVSEAEKFVTASCQTVAKNAMQVMSGIGYTTLFPIERIVRDHHLASIWTGSNKIMSVIIANEWSRNHVAGGAARRDREVYA